MFCSKCGNEIKQGEKICNKCGSSAKNKKAKIVIIVIMIIIVISIIAGFFVYFYGKKNQETLGVMANNKQTLNGVKTNDVQGGESILVENPESTAQNDRDLGLKFTKIDNKTANLTEEQKNIIEYFDYDYLDATNYEFLQRYPQVFKGTQIFTSGKVEKIINSNNETYEILFWIGESKQKYDYWQFRSNPGYRYSDENYNKYVEENKNDYVVIKGKQSDTRLIVGDFVSIRGRYIDIQNYTIDGSSYNVPVIDCYRTLIGEYNAPEHQVEEYTAKEIRKIAKTIFGDVTIREPLEEEAYIYSSNFLMNPWYICELENQSNAKFGKYFFSRTYGKGKIIDSRSSEHPFKGKEEAINREIQFAPDFEHFYMFIYDSNLKFLTVEYYDKDLKKIWEREFEDTIVATYDFTKNNVYLVANNTLYIIDTATGKDTYSPKFVGEKLGVRKLNDSLILFSTSQYDAIIKTNLEGEMIWKTNVDSRVLGVNSPQVVDNKLIVNIQTESEGDKFVIVNLEDGKIELNAKSYQ